MQAAGPRATVPLELLPLHAEVAHMRERFFDADTDTAPPPLVDVSAHQPESVSLTDLIAQGGPSLDALRRELRSAMAGTDPLASLGALFDTLDPELRRPVEIFGLLHLAANAPDLNRHNDAEVYRALRPDGSARDLTVPRITPRAEAHAALPDRPADAAAPITAPNPQRN